MLVLLLVKGNILEKAITPLLEISTRAAVICTKDDLSLQITDYFYPTVIAVTVVRIKFDLYCCYESCTAGVNLNDLNYLLLDTSNDELAITILSDFREGIINFSLENIESGIIDDEYIYLASIPDKHMDIDESKYDYDVLVGISSQDFRRILRQMRGYADFVYVTDEEVTFSSGYEDIVLKKEDGNCIIWGVEEGERVVLRLSFEYITSYVEASKLSATVWMLKSRGGNSPDTLNCPVGQELLGNIKYYFFYSPD